jgi:hypothetical protein
MSDKTQYTCRLSAHITPAMNQHLDILAERRRVPKAELAREAVRFWLDHQEDAAFSRQYFNKSLQRRLDHLDWELEVVLALLITLSNKKPRLLEQAIQEALAQNFTETLRMSGQRKAAQNRKPPED